MVTQIQPIQDYTKYIKCGEILKSPLKNYNNSIILKCFQCEKVQFRLESFIKHLQEHFKDILPLEEDNNKDEYENIHVDEIESDGVGHLAIKLEEEEDPLYPVKCEIDEEKTKDENKYELLERCSKNDDIEHAEEFEDVLDSPDEFHPDDDDSDPDSDEDYVIKEPSNKKKKNSTLEVKADESETDEDDEQKQELPVRKNIKLPPHVNEFMQSKPKVLAIIELYKTQPSLWDKYSPYYRLKDKKKQCFEEITQELNKKCSLNLTWNETAEIISHIYTKHRDDFKRIHYRNPKKKKEKKSQGKYERKPEKKLKCCWFYDKLNFLRSKVTLRLQCLDSNLPELTSEKIKQLLEIYKEVPHLWNTYLIEHICLNKRQDALDEMLKTLETKMKLKIDSSALEQYIHTIHEYFSREKRKIFGISTPEDLQNTSKREPNYYEYMLFLEDHEGPFQCPECSGIYAKPLCFRIHKSTHDGSAALKCSQCDQEFKTVSSFTTHAKRHLEDLQFVCKICNLKLLRHSDLKIHLLTHTDARPYCCEICGASYRQSNSFRKHQRQHEKRFSHTCHICSKGYYTKYRYVDHMNSHMNIRQHICNICGKGFITSRALKTHAVTHEDARNHACKLCGKTFKLKIGVLQHMRTHGSKVETERSSLIL